MAVSDHRQRHRPAPGGVSIGRPELPGRGTLGMVLYGHGIFDQENWPYLLLPNHGFAEWNSGVIDGQVIQPGTADRGERDKDAIATISHLSPILPDPALQVDMVLARANSRDLVSPEILELGLPSGLFRTNVQVGEWLWKSGRTTGLTKMQVVSIDGSYTRYTIPGGMPVSFANMIMVDTQNLTVGGLGDSGSAFFDDNMHFCGYTGELQPGETIAPLSNSLAVTRFLESTGLGFSLPLVEDTPSFTPPTTSKAWFFIAAATFLTGLAVWLGTRKK